MTESNSSVDARTIASIAKDRGMVLIRYRAGNLMKLCGLHSCQQPKQEHVEVQHHRLGVNSAGRLIPAMGKK